VPIIADTHSIDPTTEPAEMSAALTIAASAVAAILAAMPTRDAYEWQQQDLAVADVLDMLIEAVEGNGDAAQILADAAQDIRATVALDRERAEMEEAA
jgi:hypothetical protein